MRRISRIAYLHHLLHLYRRHNTSVLNSNGQAVDALRLRLCWTRSSLGERWPPSTLFLIRSLPLRLPNSNTSPVASPISSLSLPLSHPSLPLFVHLYPPAGSLCLPLEDKYIVLGALRFRKIRIWRSHDSERIRRKFKSLNKLGACMVYSFSLKKIIRFILDYVQTCYL